MKATVDTHDLRPEYELTALEPRRVGPARAAVRRLQEVVRVAYVQSQFCAAAPVGPGAQPWFPRGPRGRACATVFAWQCVVEHARKLAREVGRLELRAALGREAEGQRELLERLVGSVPGLEWRPVGARNAFTLCEPSEQVERVHRESTRSRFPCGRKHLTAESEMYSAHEADWKGDYAWGFYRLLEAASPHRLFLARVKEVQLCRLQETLGEMLSEYRREYLRPDDLVSIVLLSNEGWAGREGNRSCVAVYAPEWERPLKWFPAFADPDEIDPN